MIRLSLIIATYNRAEPLLGALRSVVAQHADPQGWECVVVNNNSQDDTVDRFDRFAADYPQFNLRLVTECAQGLSFARNRGIAESRGQYIAIIDDDERINADFVTAYIAFFDTHPEALAAGGRIIPEYPAGRPAWLSPLTERPIANPIDLGAGVRCFPAGRIPGGGNMALRRAAIERFGAFNTSLGRTGTRLIGGEESDLFARFAAAGVPCWYVPEAVMWHIIPPEKLTIDYFRRLCYNVGITQRVRARLSDQGGRLLGTELLKWGVVLLLAMGYLVRMQGAKARYLLLMRWQISRGIGRG